MTVTQDPAASPVKSKAPSRIKMRVITKYGSLAAPPGDNSPC
jgi:hypothetical protein